MQKMLNKKQIVFIEPKPTVNGYRIARSLKLTKRYETILISFSKVDKKFFGKAYNKILTLELSHKLRFKNLKNLLQKVVIGEIKKFFKDIKKMKPYLFQITGPDLFSLMALYFLKKNFVPKIYYSNDLWGADARNFFFTKEFWIKGEIQKIIEKKCFEKVDGILTKKPLKEFALLKYNVNAPKIALFSTCLEEWTFPPEKKKNKEIHLCYGGSPNTTGGEKISFMEVINTLTSQKIYFHSYGSCVKGKDNQSFDRESKENRYYFTL